MKHSTEVGTRPEQAETDHLQNPGQTAAFYHPPVSVSLPDSWALPGTWPRGKPDWPEHGPISEQPRLVLGSYFDIFETMKSSDVIGSLGALASEPRLAVFRLLVRRGPDGYSPSELSVRLDIPSPTLSFHLKELMRAKLVISRRESRNLYYSPNIGRMNALVAFLTENCCSLANEPCDSPCRPLAAAASGRKRA
jgi:ArsR family transcriptional regulator, arsenate/arsenite/antimonite-responsive transcriptional repressor